MGDDLTPFERLDREFYYAYGRALANWAHLERALLVYFRAITQLPPQLAYDVFYSARSFQGRQDMVWACLPHAKTTAVGREFIGACLNRAGAFSSARNVLAHDAHTLEADHGDRIGRGRLIRSPDGRTFSIEEVRRASANFLAISNVLEFSRGEQKLLVEPELSRALLDLLPQDALGVAADRSRLDALIAELVALSQKA